MRSILKKFNGKTLRVKATFGGYKTNRIGNISHVLLFNITEKNTNKILTNHCHIHYNSELSVMNLCKGDIIEFSATICKYFNRYDKANHYHNFGLNAPKRFVRL